MRFAFHLRSELRSEVKKLIQDECKTHLRREIKFTNQNIEQLGCKVTKEVVCLKTWVQESQQITDRGHSCGGVAEQTSFINRCITQSMIIVRAGQITERKTQDEKSLERDSLKSSAFWPVLLAPLTTMAIKEIIFMEHCLLFKVYKHKHDNCSFFSTPPPPFRIVRAGVTVLYLDTIVQ